MVDRPGTIGVQHPARTFLLRDAKPALAGGGKKPQAGVAGLRSRRRASSPVFGQTKSIEDALGARRATDRQTEETAIWRQRSERRFRCFAPNGYFDSASEVPNLIVAVMSCSPSLSLTTKQGLTRMIFARMTATTGACDVTVRQGQRLPLAQADTRFRPGVGRRWRDRGQRRECDSIRRLPAH